MLRYSNAILLSLVYTLLVFQSIIPMVDYQINKTRIAENLCINKASAEKSCHGHCYLKKQITKAEGSSLPISRSSNNKIALQDIGFNHLVQNSLCIPKMQTNESPFLHIEKKPLLYNQYISSIFRPPIV